jgi:hypothetical protein
MRQRGRPCSRRVAVGPPAQQGQWRRAARGAENPRLGAPLDAKRPGATPREWCRRTRGFGASGAPNSAPPENPARRTRGRSAGVRISHAGTGGPSAHPACRLRARRAAGVHVRPGTPATPRPPARRRLPPLRLVLRARRALLLRPPPASTATAVAGLVALWTVCGADQAGNRSMLLRQLESVERRLVAPDRDGVSSSPADRGRPRPSAHCRARAGPAQPQRPSP